MQILFWFLLPLFSALSHADCNDLRIQNLDTVDFQSDPTPTETFTVRRSGSGGCSFFVTIDNGSSSSFSNRRLLDGSNWVPVQICADSNCSYILKKIPEVSSSAEVLIGSFPSGVGIPQSISFNLYPRIGSIEYQHFGTYDDVFQARVYEGTWNGSNSLEDSDNFTVRYKVAKKIDLSIVSTGASFDQNSTNKMLNFGMLSAGQQMSFDLIVKFNAGYRVRLSSQNNGALKHVSYSDTVPYTLALNGGAVPLDSSSSSPVTFSQGSGVSQAGGLRFAGTVTIGAMGTPRTGTYQDTITITVSTTE